MIEAIVMKWLIGQTGLSCSSRPNLKAKESFITVERVGGNVKNRLDHPRLAIQAWAETEAKAAKLAYQIRNILMNTWPPDVIRGVSVDTIYNFPDPDTKKARYQLIVNLTTQL